MSENRLYYGDNLKILRDYIPDESVDLIYLMRLQHGTFKQGACA